MGARKKTGAREEDTRLPFPSRVSLSCTGSLVAPTTSYYLHAPATLANRLQHFRLPWVGQRLFPRTFRFLSIGELRVIKRGLEYLKRKDSTLSGKPNVNFRKHLFGRRFEIKNFGIFVVKFLACASPRIFEHLKNCMIAHF